MHFIPSGLLLVCLALASGCGDGCGGGAISAPPAERASPRLATVTPSLTALAVRLGLQDHLVGRSQYGPEVPGVPVVAGVSPNIEAVLYVEPDIVAIGRFPSNSGDIDKLRASGVPRVMALGVVTLDDLRHSALALGDAFDASDAARAFVAELDAALDAARRSRVAQQKPRVLLVYGRSGGVFYSTAGGDHVADILDALGARNVAAGGPVTLRLSLERIIHLAPDTIIHAVVDAELPTPQAALKFWQNAAPSLPAVQRRRIIVWEDDGLALNGPRIVDAIHKLTARLEALPP